MHTHAHTYDQLKFNDIPMHVAGLWKDTGLLKVNHMHAKEKHMQTPQEKVPVKL